MQFLLLGAVILGSVLSLHLLFRVQLYVQREQVRVYKGKKYRIVDLFIGDRKRSSYLGDGDFKVEVAGWTQWKDFKFYPEFAKRGIITPWLTPYSPETYAVVCLFRTEEEADRAFKLEFDDLAECRRLYWEYDP